jgi:hypothetical protein
MVEKLTGPLLPNQSSKQSITPAKGWFMVVGVQFLWSGFSAEKT